VTGFYGAASVDGPAEFDDKGIATAVFNPLYTTDIAGGLHDVQHVAEELGSWSQLYVELPGLLGVVDFDECVVQWINLHTSFLLNSSS
jgi:hypothetical protein